MKLTLEQVCISNTSCRRIPHSPNVLNTMHWATRLKWKNAWSEEVGWQILNQLKEREILKKKKGKKKVTITYFQNKLYDKDNLYGSAKGCIDALRYNGLIANDDPKSINLKLQQIKVAKRKEEHVEIIIE